MSRDSFRNILITIFTANFDDISELHILVNAIILR